MSLKAIGAALTSSDLTPRFDECDIDRVTAVGFARDMGSILLKLRLGVATDAKPLIERASLFVRRKVPHIHRRASERLAAWALREWLDGVCQACGGGGIKPDPNNVTKACQPCNASGVRRYSDNERTRGAGLPMTYKHSKALNLLSDYLQRQFSGAANDVRRVME